MPSLSEKERMQAIIMGAILGVLMLVGAPASIYLYNAYKDYDAYSKASAHPTQKLSATPTKTTPAAVVTPNKTQPPIEPVIPKKKQNPLAQYKSDPPATIMSRVLYTHFSTESNQRRGLGGPVEITHPDTRESYTVESSAYIGVGGIKYIIKDQFGPILAKLKRPAICDPSYKDDGSWFVFGNLCQVEIYNTLAKLKTGKPLYKEVATLDPKGLQALLDLVWIEPSTPLLGTTAETIYPALGKIVLDYLAIWQTLEEYGTKKALVLYQKEIRKRGVLPTGRQEGMWSFYNDFTSKLTLPPSINEDEAVYLVGFWLRRLSDQTAPLVLGYLQKIDKHYNM